jgi:hypothetical protein
VVAGDRSEHRAWVGTESVDAAPFEAGKFFKASVSYRNSGKTPATNVRAVLDFILTATKPPALIVGPNQSDVEESVGVLHPNESGAVVVSAKSATEAGHVAALKAGLMDVYVFGTLTYTDIYDQPHWSRFCFYKPEITGWGVCGFHNAVGDGLPPKVVVEPRASPLREE